MGTALALDYSRYTHDELQQLYERLRDADDAKEQARFERDLKEAPDSLAYFIRAAWEVLEPAQPYVHGWHIDVLAEHLEAVTRGDITRLLINIPPGTMKSLATSVFWPAWMWGPKAMAYSRFIGASHEEGLATRDNLKMRRLIESDWFQKRWPTPLTGDQNQKTYFENTAMGWRQSCPVKSMTGRRGDCVAGDAIISTDIGDITAEEIVKHAAACNVLSLDHDTGELVYRPVQAVARSSASEIYRVHTSEGIVVECTGDHRIYTARGYVQARLLSPGDLLLRAVRGAADPQCSHDEERPEERKNSDLLRSVVCGEGHKSEEWKPRALVQRLWSEDTQGQAAMLGGLRPRSAHEAGSVEETKSAKHGLPHMQQRGATAQPDDTQDLLLPEMRGLREVEAGSLRGQPNVARRGERETLRPAESETVSQDAEGDRRAGWQQVRVLQRYERTVCAPHGPRHSEQHMGQPSDFVQELPHHMAQFTTVETRPTAVALVECVSRAEVVYDLQVEGTRCFFANGILVHNCVLWDDPHSVEDAHSAPALETATRIFRETLPTRLNNPETSAIVVLMQRLNEKDVSGVILKEGFGYEHLCIPMEYEGPRKATSLGWVDPRTKVGELLFPARFPRAVVERDKRIMGEYAVAGQFQQRPSPAGGGIIKPEQFMLWSYKDPLPDLYFVLQSYDTAFTANTQNDPTACLVLGIGEHATGPRKGEKFALILDAWTEYLPYPKLRTKVMDDWKAEYGGIKDDITHPPRKADVIIIEEKGSGQSLLQDLRVANVPVRGYNPGKADKITRAHMVAPLLEAGLIYVLESKRDHGQAVTWARPLIEQCTQFPNGEHDDMVDTLTQALIYLRDTGMLQLDFVPTEKPDTIDYHERKQHRRNPYGN